MILKMTTKYNSLNDAIQTIYGTCTRISRMQRISGGGINDAYRLVLNDGLDSVFMKANRKENLAFFEAEAVGVDAIAETKAIGVPQVLGMGTDEERDCSFLLLEYMAEQKPVEDYWEIFARQLAQFHRADVEVIFDKGFGFREDNFIGARMQKNAPRESWIAFFRDCRLTPQFEDAVHYFDTADRKRMDYFLEHLDDFLTEPEYPSLLHGDLWSGNFLTGNDGRAWLIDPAVYVGNREVDIAMTELFGGFSQEFYVAYREAASLQDGYEDRKDIYNLYQLLNHLNMFGRSYLPAVLRIVWRYA